MRKVLLFLLSAVIAVSVCATPASAASVDYMNYEAYLRFDATDVSEHGTVRLSVSMEILDEIEVSDMEFKIFWSDYMRAETGEGYYESVYPCFSYNSETNKSYINPVFDDSEIGYYSDYTNGYIKFFNDNTSGSNLTLSGTVEIFWVEVSVNEKLPEGSYKFELECIEMYSKAEDDSDDIMKDVVLFSNDEYRDIWNGERLEIYGNSEMPISREGSYFEVYANKKLEMCYSTNESVFEVLSYEYDEDFEMTVISLWANKLGSAYLCAASGVIDDEAFCRIAVVESKPWHVYVSNKSEIRTEYVVGEELDLTGMKLKLNYSDNGWEIVDSGYAVSGTYDFSTAGEKDIRIYYEHESLYTYLPVTVYNLPQIDLGGYGLHEGSDTIYTVSASTSAEELLSKITIPQSDRFSVRISKNESTYSGTVGTGMTYDIIFDGRTVKSYTIAVENDVNGDGVCNILDMLRLKKAIAGINGVTVNDTQKIALHGNTEEQNAADLVNIQKQLIKTE